MIQRQQSLWLLLSAVCSFFSFQYPFYTGTRKDEHIATGIYAELDGGSSLFLLLLTGISIILSLIAIFLFKDRKTQLKLAVGGIVLSVIIIVLYFSEIGDFLKGRMAFTCLLVFAILVGYIMAARGIWKDEKLVKSLDKLR